MKTRPIQVLYSDSAVVAVNKPPGLPVHEAPGPGGSVLRALRLQHGLSGLTPAHRLDKDASGVLLLARTKKAARALERQWQTVEKTYLALCEGIPSADAGLVDAPILEHQTGKPERLRNALRFFSELNPGVTVPPPPPPKTSAVHPAGRSAQTEYRVIEAFGRGQSAGGIGSGGAGGPKERKEARGWSWLEVRPRQGRMHQIRVHLARIGCPIVGDRLYGVQSSVSGTRPGRHGGSGPRPAGFGLGRLALHAAKLVFPNPNKPGKRLTVEAPMADDLAALLERLRSAGKPRTSGAAKSEKSPFKHFVV
ncbi:MAG: RluA family pseudouridine synthase [Planctomycetota bacterium]|nr:RluA family pseudouridine synthase [Planctomycetota bacterium]